MIFLSVFFIGLAFLFLFLFFFQGVSRLSFFNPVFILFLVYCHGVFLRFIFLRDDGFGVFEIGVFSMALFLMFFSVGYIFASSKYLPIVKGFNYFPGLRFLVILIALVLAFFFFKDVNSFGARFIVGSDGARTSNFLFLLGADILISVFLLHCAYAFSNGFKVEYRYYLIFFLAIVMYSAISARFSVILFFVMFAFVYTYYRANYRMYIIGVLSFFVVFAGLGVLRASRQGGGDTSVASLLFEQLVQRPYLLDVNKTGHIIEYFRLSGDYWFGATFFHTFFNKLGLVDFDSSPRTFIARNIFGRTNESGVPAGMVAEVFMNFSWSGLVIGGFLVGYISKICFNTVKSLGRPFTVVIYAVFLQGFLLALTVDFQAGLFAVFKTIVPVVILDGFYRKYFFNGCRSPR